MRLLDASDDDSLVTQAWGDDPDIETWVATARQIRRATENLYARRGTPCWARTGGAWSLVGLLTGATRDADLPNIVTTLTVGSMWLDLAAYDPEETLRNLVDGALFEDALRLSIEPNRARDGAMAVVLHHAEASRAAAGVQRFKSLPLAALERLSPSGVRVDIFPTWAATLTVSELGRVSPGFTIVLALR